jgi:hypothetical protein
MTHKGKVNRKKSNSDVGTKKEPEFNALRRVLFAQFSPRTPLQQTAVEAVAACSLRFMQATRFVANDAAQSFRERTPEAEGEANTDTSPKVTRWYGADRRSLREGIKFLSLCAQQFEASPTIREEWKEDMDRGWGEDLFAELKKWEPKNYEAVLLVGHLITHAQTFRRPLPNIPEGEVKVMPDPFLQKQMVCKLIRQEIRHLQALAQISDQRADAPGGVNENAMSLAFSYLKSAMDDLQRAVEWFMRLRRHRL